MQQLSIQTKIVHNFGDLNKSVPAIRKKGFYTSHLLKNEEIGGIFVFSGSEL
jgi:hypothetical protein